MDPNANVDSPCRQTGTWGFVGYLEDGTAVPIGVYDLYCDGAAHSNAWAKNTPKADRWEATPLYEEVIDE